MNRIDRLLATILLLQGRRMIRAEEIADHFEISLRTVYRDMAALSEAGVPVVAEAGMGYSLVKGFHVPPVMFSPEEASALFMGGELVEHLTDPSLQTQMRSALLKIRSILPHSHQEQIDRLKKSTALFITPTTPRGRSEAVLTRIQTALARRIVVELVYKSPEKTNPTRRLVEPVGLIYYSDHWHLIAYCRLRADFRDFRTDRIVELRLTAETFQSRDDYSMDRYLESWRKDCDTFTARVRFTGTAVARARRSWFSGLMVERPDGDGIIMEFPTGMTHWVSGWLLSFGTEVEVLEPASLRKMVAEQAARLARHHD